MEKMEAAEAQKCLLLFWCLADGALARYHLRFLRDCAAPVRYLPVILHHHSVVHHSGIHYFRVVHHPLSSVRRVYPTGIHRPVFARLPSPSMTGLIRRHACPVRRIETARRESHIFPYGRKYCRERITGTADAGGRTPHRQP